MSPDQLTPKHVRAARALLAWSQQDLANSAKVATSTVADFERGQRTPVTNNATAIRSALEGAGIRFLATGAIIGPAIPTITSTHRAGTPIRWVDLTDLNDWANRTDGAVSLPKLISNLIQASHGTTIKLRFPSDEGVRHAGWDGITETSKSSVFVPQGVTGWEIGTQANTIATKATDDYLKRTAAPGVLNPSQSSFVFVTPRNWSKKDEWAKAKQKEGKWKEVRAYDGNDLIHWIEQNPAVGLWLATRLGKRPPGTRLLEDAWNEWSLATKWPLTEDLVLCDRDEDATAILRWLRGSPSLLSLQASTSDEVVAFFHATLSTLPQENGDRYRALTIVATNADCARTFIDAPAPLILVMQEPDPGLAASLVSRGHFVLQAYDDRPATRGDVQQLKRPSRSGISAALVATGIPEEKASALARDSGRNLAILRRLIPNSPGREPSWSKLPPPSALVAALLVGGWDETSEGDKACFAALAGQPYDAAIQSLAPYVGDMDKPLRKVGSSWRVASPPDAWFFLAPYLTAADIAAFENAAHNVMGSADPRFQMKPDERWLASVNGVHRTYSGLMRHGMGEVLILLALRGEDARLIADAARRADAIVAKLLHGADAQRWWSLSRDFRLLAEASPTNFLAAIEHSLDQSDPPIRSLFQCDEDHMFGAEHLSDLLWALESLAWSPDLMSRVSLILAKLDGIDNPSGKYANRPANSLREIHLLWIPQTFSTLDQRLSALDLVRRKSPNAAWKLMQGILPRGHDSSTPSPSPRWRDYTVENVEIVTYGLIARGAAEVTRRILEDVGLDRSRWIQLISRLSDLAPDSEDGLKALETAASQFENASDRIALWTSLRGVLHHHRQFPEAEWSMDTRILDRLEAIYNQLAPDDPFEQIVWLFEQSAVLPNPSKRGWKAEQEDIDLVRVKAAGELFKAQGADGIFALARLSDNAGYIGKALVESGLSKINLDELVAKGFRSDEQRERNIAHGMTIAALKKLDQTWGEALFSRAKEQSWANTALLAILKAFPANRWTWNLAANAGQYIETEYWRQVPVFWMGDKKEEIPFAITKLISVGRARQALSLIDSDGKSELPSELLVKLLLEAAQQPIPENENNEAVMFQHYVAEIFHILDERSDVDKDTFIQLEWNYLPLLERSRRPVRALVEAISEQPTLFIDIITAVYKPDDEHASPVDETLDPAHVRAIADQAYRLLELWKHIPGKRDDGKIDVVRLKEWVSETRLRAKGIGRLESADYRIGTMLSSALPGDDTHWPAEAVRDCLDHFRSEEMRNGFIIGKRNRRGVTSRSPGDGGNLERGEAQKYRLWAKASADTYPYTASALNDIADSYEQDAKRHDDDTERRDWSY